MTKTIQTILSFSLLIYHVAETASTNTIHTRRINDNDDHSRSLAGEEELPQSDWYTKYETYPEYCSTPDQMEQRSIPPLKKQAKNGGSNSDDIDLELEIIHVTSIIRHGTRTPTKVHTCWDGFWSSESDTSVWNCELMSMVAPPSPQGIQHCEFHPGSCHDHTHNVDGDGAMFLFEKKYNALDSPPQLKNELNGTCQIGQLLLRGYVQELHNGEMFRSAYVKDENDTNIDESMVLFDINTTAMEERPYEPPHLYYRADDDQRTLMSGQVFLRGLFGDLLHKHAEELGSHTDPTITVHTADRNRDVLSVNKDICPRLEEIEHQIKNSTEYKDKFENSEESKQLTLMIETEFGSDIDSDDVRRSLLDCMMSTICTDRTLPKVIDDYGKADQDHYAGYGVNLFDRLQKYVSPYFVQKITKNHDFNTYIRTISNSHVLLTLQTHLFPHIMFYFGMCSRTYQSFTF